MPSPLTRNAKPMPPKFSELMMSVRASRLKSPPTTPVVWPPLCTAETIEITSLLVARSI
ncbi:hypothetical protein D3C80_1678690 [compost metagenome]